MPKRRAEVPARARITVGHVDSPALVRSDDRDEPVLAAQRRHEWVDQAAGDQEKVAKAFLRQCIQNEVASERHGSLGIMAGPILPRLILPND